MERFPYGNHDVPRDVPFTKQRKRMRTLYTRLAALICFLLTAGSAHAEGFALYEYSARGVALGGALVARKPDASAAAYNPALMTKLPGIHVMGGVSAITPDGKIRTTDSNGRREITTLKPSTWIVPHLYYTQQLNEHFTVGVGEFTRYGLGFEYPHEWPGRFNIYQAHLTSMSVNPSIAWAATDNLSLAAGVELVYVSLDLKKRAKIPLRNYGINGFGEVDSNIQDAEAFGVGFNLAGHYQFNDQWAVGLQYRSQVRVRAWGDMQYSYMGYKDGNDPRGDPIARAIYAGAFHDGPAHAVVLLPDSIAAGIAWTPIPQLSVELGATWTHWSTFRDLNIHIPDPLPTSEIHEHWKDCWRINLGVEYEPLDWLVLRAGYIYDQSPMTRGYASYLVPTNDRNMYSLGVGFKWDAWTLDLATAYIQPKNRSYKGNEAIHVLDSKTRNTSTTIFSVSLGYQF